MLSLVTQLREANSEVQRLREAEASYIHEREVAAAEAVIARNAAAYDQGMYDTDEGGQRLNRPIGRSYAGRMRMPRNRRADFGASG